MSHSSTTSLERVPRHRHQPTRSRNPRGPERLSDLADTLSRSTLESILRSLDDVADVVEGVLAAVGGRQRGPLDVAERLGRRRGRGPQGHGRSCECGDAFDDACCEWQSCACLCCVVDADLEIRARVGERRVIPIRIDNPRVRERHITLNLGRWSRRGGGEAQFAPEASLDREELTIAGCSHEQVTMTVTTSGAREDERGDVDVDACTVYYTDLRIEGCDTRPVRIALVLLPRDCEAFEARCSCSCC